MNQSMTLGRTVKNGTFDLFRATHINHLK